MNRRLTAFIVVLLFAVATPPLAAVPPWLSFIPVRRIDADPNKTYELSEHEGPWMILAATFTNSNAEEVAGKLVLELRQRFKLPAYIHKQEYDFSEPIIGLGVDKYNNPKKMRHMNASRYTGVAVLVGNFESFEDPNSQKALEKLKYAFPESIDARSGKWTVQRMKVMRELRQKLNISDERDERGPLGNAFITRNPLLPEEYFTAGGLDAFVINLNKGVRYSLLDCQGRYTVRVATFGGESTMDLKKMQTLNRTGTVSDKLEVAAANAHRLTSALRNKGIEAYEFHDRYESMVTVGSFDSVGKKLPDGKIDPSETILKIIKEFGADKDTLPGQAQVGFRPKQFAGVKFDVHPVPVVVPRRSIGAMYAHGNRMN